MSKLYRLRHEQRFPTDRNALWDFIATPNNLAAITPPSMRFETLHGGGEAMFPGQVIAYRLRPLPGWKTSWVTEITHMENGRYFVDEQRFGPYAFWHHLHRLDDVPGGVKMTDTVHYKIPFDFLGNWVNALVVKKKLDEIFAYRRRKMETLFGRL